MKYEVRCACGKPHAVTGADAGATLRCACGQSVDVPPLHQLRTAAGQVGVAPELLLTSLLLNKELPDTTDCVGCSRGTDGVVWADVVCERADETTDRTDRVGGCFANLLLAFVGVRILFSEQASRSQGRDVSFRIPVRCCDACA